MCKLSECPIKYRLNNEEFFCLHNRNSGKKLPHLPSGLVMSLRTKALVGPWDCPCAVHKAPATASGIRETDQHLAKEELHCLLFSI